MKIIISNEITIMNPNDKIISYCKEHLIISNPDYYKKQRMGLWMGNTPTHLYLYRIDGDKYILPYGTWPKIKRYVPTGVHITYDLAENKPVNYNAKLPLYNYQEKAVKLMKSQMNGILQAPCGSGKTQMGISLAIAMNKKTLWITHTKDLLNQSYDRAAEYIKDKYLLGTITAGKVKISDGITFATVQTLSKLDLSLYKYTWDLIIIDECHRLAGTPTKVTMFSHVINHLAAPYKYGLSATVHRGDGLIESTFALLGEIICLVPETAVSEKTTDVTIQEIITCIKMSECCLDTDGTLIYNKLIDYLVKNPKRNILIAKKLAENKDHNNIIMSDRLQHLQNIIDCLVDLGIPKSKIRIIDGYMTSKKAREARKQAIQDIREGTANYLFLTYNLGKEGLDIPTADRLYLALPKKDFAIVTQSIGRISRKAMGKEEAICYDFVDNIGFCIGAWKKRKGIYKKKGCKIIESNTPIQNFNIQTEQVGIFNFSV